MGLVGVLLGLLFLGINTGGDVARLAGVNSTQQKTEQHLPDPLPQIASQSGVWQRVFYPHFLFS